MDSLDKLYEIKNEVYKEATKHECEAFEDRCNAMISDHHKEHVNIRKMMDQENEQYKCDTMPIS
jgi:ABC-type dipeptide/oligopeptide/nickel transport system ATPase component